MSIGASLIQSAVRAEADAADPGTASPPGSPPDRRRGGGVGRLAPAALLVPASVVLIVVIGWPLVQLVIMSFQEFGRAQVFGRPAPFIGLENYAEVLADSQFWQVLGRSLLFCLVNVITAMGLGTLVALLMQRLPRGVRLLVSLGLLLAWAMPALTAVVIWGWMFDTQFGVVNYVITQVTGLDFMGHSWLSDPVSFFGVATVIVTWGAVPFVAFTIYAGLTQVPEEVVEAAQLDGAGFAARFRLVVFPYLRSIFLVVTVLQVIWDLRVFTQIYALQGIGGIRSQTDTIGVYIVKESVGTGQYGSGAAIAVILVFIMAAISWYYVRHNLKEEQA